MPRQRLTETEKLIMKDARSLAKWLTIEMIALVNPDSEPIILPIRREGSAPKKHATGRSLELNAVEALIELRSELRRHNAHLPKVYSLYLYLRRVVNA